LLFCCLCLVFSCKKDSLGGNTASKKCLPIKISIDNKSYILFKYNEFHRLVSKSAYDSLAKISEYDSFSYTNGLLTRMDICSRPDSASNLIGVYSYVGSLISKAAIYNGPTTVLSNKEWDIIDSIVGGRILSQKYVYPNGAIMSRSTYSYDSKGNVLTEKEGNDFTVFEYDNNTKVLPAIPIGEILPVTIFNKNNITKITYSNISYTDNYKYFYNGDGYAIKFSINGYSNSYIDYKCY
jgi:hypothetical protein